MTPTASENATLRTTTLKLRKKEYSLHLDFAALSTAEALLKKQGVQVNLLKSLDLADLDASGLAAMLFAALKRDQPEMTYLEALGLISLPHLNKIFDAILEAYVAAQKDPDTEDEDPND